MATNPFKQLPQTSSTSENCSPGNAYHERLTPAQSSSSGSVTNASTQDSSSSILKQRATCACSNISIMQLFHEMKQKYPTVPDTVVSELVTQNCHDRPACISRLEEAVLGTPAQTTYPAQSIHSGSLKRRSAEQRTRLAAGNRQPADGGNGVADSSSSNSSTSSRESSIDSSRLRGTTEGPQAAGGVTGVVAVNDRLCGDGRAPTKGVAHRPTTLAFGAANSATMGYGGAPPQLPSRPTRAAPGCPAAGGQTPTITTRTTASSSADLGETVNLQVNVTVSPKAGGGPLLVGQRHTSTISLQPEPPYSLDLAQVSSTFNSGPPVAARAMVSSRGNATAGGGGAPGIGGTGAVAAAAAGGGGSGRSSTSVNLTLRQPTDGRPHSPIHIHASPLKYTAHNFNAQAGIQSKLEVTFRDGFGSFSAMRAHIPPGYQQQQQQQRQQHQLHPLDAAQTSLSNTLQYQQRQEPSLPDQYQQQRDYYGGGCYQPPTGSPSRFVPPIASSSPLARGALRGGSPYAGFGAQLENDGLTKEMRYQNFVVAEMAVSQQLEQKQRLSREVERKQMQFESICREIFVLQQPLRYIDAELLDREVLLLAAEVEQLQKEVDSCDDEEARVFAAAAAGGSSITDGLSALSVEGGSPMLSTSAAVVNRPPRPPRPPPPRAAAQSPSRGSSGSVTPGTPLFPGSLFGGGSPVGAPSSSSSSSPCSTSSSSFTPNYGGGPTSGDAALPSSRLQQPLSSSSDAQAAAAGLNQPWTCTLCTFQNHELMTSCELCTLPKASGIRTFPESTPRSCLTAASVLGTDVCDGSGGSVAPGGAALLRRQHHSVDTGVAAVAAAAAAAAAAVVGASIGPATAPPYPEGYEMSPPPFASLPSSSATSMAPAVASPPQPEQATVQAQQQQQQQQQTNPPPLQNAQYQQSSIEC